MNKLVTVLLIAATLTACANSKVINGIEYDTFGIANKDSKENPNIQYEPCWGNVFWGIFLIETIIAPIYFFGYSLFEPVGPKPMVKGEVVK